ncbi:unnamed protein product [Phyllotreta striolata]|uniref:Sialin n=1 Tax=Phyllotreta striolata TaxID=444603 RepID=A0A9N9TTE5_PHYSR|nr:unnamed protein product [Phyllotreta striolata]
MPPTKTDYDTNKVYTAVSTGYTLKHTGEFTWKIWNRKRYIISILTFFGFFNVFTLRSNISIALVDMISLKNITFPNTTVVEKKEFDWQPVQLGYVLSSFYYGYVLTQILGGYLAAKFGGAKIYGIGIAGTAIFTLATPWAAKTSIYCLIAIRTVEGLFEGVVYPSSMAIWANWAPPLEKTRLTSICLSGAYVGTVVAMPTSSLLASYFGWESIFYVFGGIAVLWYVIWLIVVRESPSQDPRIHPDELDYISNAIVATKTGKNTAIPWKALLTSKSVWAISIILGADNWSFHTLVAFLPQVMKYALNFDLNESGVLSALPYVAMAVLMLLGGQISDWFIRKKFITVTNVRKAVTVIGFIGGSVSLFSSAEWLSPTLTPIFVVLGATFRGFALSGTSVNTLDIAPRFASVILGIGNTCASIPGVVSPILAGYIVKDLTNVDQWKIIFYISSGMYLLAAAVSLLFLSAVEQPWAKNEEPGQISEMEIESTNV